MHAGEGRVDSVGKRIALSTTFIGGPLGYERSVHGCHGTGAQVQELDVFLTMTCNQNWDEIKSEVFTSQTAQDCPDLVTRAFRAKLEELKRKLMDKDIREGPIVDL